MCGSSNPYVDEAVVKWMCLACAYQNPEGASRCAMCGLHLAAPQSPSGSPLPGPASGLSHRGPSTPDSASKARPTGSAMTRRPSAVIMRPLDEGPSAASAHQGSYAYPSGPMTGSASSALDDPSNPLAHMGLYGPGPSTARRYSTAVSTAGGLGPAGPHQFMSQGVGLVASMTPVRESAAGTPSWDRWATVSGSGLFPRVYEGPGGEGGSLAGPPSSYRRPSGAPHPLSASAAGPATVSQLHHSISTPGMGYGPGTRPASAGPAHDMFSVIGGGAAASAGSAAAMTRSVSRDQFGTIGGGRSTSGVGGHGSRRW